ncbi:hypothetical protein ACFL6U_21960 [Planctomycetota bacterium]
METKKTNVDNTDNSSNVDVSKECNFDDHNSDEIIVIRKPAQKDIDDNPGCHV